jgi:hypothetical protein
MMTRTQTISLAVLDVLSGWDAPAAEAVVYAQVSARVPGGVLVSEWDDALGLCQGERWVSGERDALRGVLLSITNKGRALRRA